MFSGMPYQQSQVPAHIDSALILRLQKALGISRSAVYRRVGMAFGRDPRTAVLVQIGQLRGLSDIAGRHVVHLDGSPQSRRELATKLKAAGCAVDTEGTDWLSHGDFSQPVRRKRRHKPARREPPRRPRRKRRR